MIERIRALFAKEGAPGTTPAEAAAARRLALRLMEKHGVTPGMLAPGRSFELGTVRFTRRAVRYRLKLEFLDLAERAVARVNGLRYGDLQMQAECARYLPPPGAKVERSEAGVEVAWSHSPELVLARDLPQPLDPRHVAWIVSSALNLACYLGWAGLVHGDLSPETYAVSPEHHNGAGLGGWWYAQEEGARWDFLPARSARLLTPDQRVTRRADARLDLNAVRLLGRELLGEAPAPAAMRQWLRGASAGVARNDYREWRGVLEKAFGPRRFVVMNGSAKDLYEEE